MAAEQELDEYDVAVVVFCRTRAADESDAEDRAKLAVRHTLADQGSPRMPLEIYLPSQHFAHGVSDEPVQVAAVKGLRYVGGQGIRLQATAEPYQNANMGRPIKGKPEEPRAAYFRGVQRGVELEKGGREVDQIIALGTPDITAPKPVRDDDYTPEAVTRAETEETP